MYRWQALAFFLGALFVACAPDPGEAADWPRWSGSTHGNMISGEKGLPERFDPGKKSPTGSGIDPATTRNVKWVVRLGSNAYGNPTIAANGVLYVMSQRYLWAVSNKPNENGPTGESSE